MVNWWNELSSLQQMFTYFAFPATLILIVQIILFIIGLSGGEGDADVSHSDIDSDGLGADDSEPGGDITESSDLAEVRLLTFRSIVAFFAVGGWTGVVMAGLDRTLTAVD